MPPTFTSSPSPTAMASVTPSATQTQTASLSPSYTMTPTEAANATPTASPSPSASPTATPTPIPSPTATAIVVFWPTPAVSVAHLWLERPIGPEGANRVEAYYPYGSTGGDLHPIHHGVEFMNPLGTVVLAVADGTVEVAGDDYEIIYSYEPGFYGNMVVLRLDEMYHDEPVFVLYAHLERIDVTEGQRVRAGEPLGLVGMTGGAWGPHLHLEVRVGENDYWHTRNPELWLRPLEGRGVIAGRVVNRHGELVPQAVIHIAPADKPTDVWYQRESYAVGELETPQGIVPDGVNPDDGWLENWATGDVWPGVYVVRVPQRSAGYEVIVRPGEISYVTVVVD